MKTNIRRTFRPTLDLLEDRLALSSFQWGIGRGITSATPSGWSLSSGGAAAAVLTAAHPAPALSSFNWGAGPQPAAGWDIAKHVPTVAQPAAGWDIGTNVPPAAPPAAAAVQDIHFTGPVNFSEMVVTATPSIILKRVHG
jgi:hypothetical protein